MDAAADVFVLARSIHVAVWGCEMAFEACRLNGTAGACVEGHGVVVLLVDTLDDVDFAVFGPIGADEPEGGPDAADAAGHVGDVGDEETFVPGLFGLDAQGGTAGLGVGDDVCVVDAEEDGRGVAGVGHHGEFGGGCVEAGLEFDVAVGGVGVGEEVELREEVGGWHVVRQGVGVGGGGEEGGRDQRESWCSIH